MQRLLAATDHELHDMSESLLVSFPTMPGVPREYPWLPGDRESSEACCARAKARYAGLASAVYCSSFDEVRVLRVHSHIYFIKLQRRLTHHVLGYHTPQDLNPDNDLFRVDAPHDSWGLDFLLLLHART